MNTPAFRIGAAALLVAMCLVPCAAHADTHYVPDEGTIQTVISLADPGDEVVVRAGTYMLSATVSVNKANLVLRGEGSSATIVQVAYGIGYAFSISANGVTVEDFQIEKTDKTGVQNLVFIGADDVTIRDNLVFGKYVLGDPDVSRALEVAYGSANLTVEGNTIHSLRQPAYLNGSLAAPTTGTISGNHVYGTKGWVVDGANMSFAGNTWGSGAQANYLDIAILAATPAGYYPDIVAISAANSGAVIEDQRAVPAVLSVVYVDDDAPAGGDGTVTKPYQTIGPAITRVVTGGTVNVADGVYEEQVVIAKALTLGGGGSGGCIVRSPVSLTSYFTTSTNNYPVVYVHDCDGVTVRNLTVDGAGRGNTNYRFIGVGFRNAGGTLDHCDVINIQDTPFSGAQHGVAVYWYNDDGTPRGANVWDCDIHDFQKNAMALNTGGSTALSVDVRRNTVTGKGATTVTAQNGIQVWADLGSGTIGDNVISGIAYDNTSATTKWVATSILNYYADLDILGNDISAGHMCVYNIDGAGSISGNTIAVEKVGVYAYGICATDPPAAKPSPFGEDVLVGSGRPMLGAPLATLDVDILDNDVTFSGPDNTDTYGIEADAGYGTDDLDVTVSGNRVAGFDYGIAFWQCTSDCSSGVFTNIVAVYNSIVGNTSYGMYSNASYITADGRYNWWGDATGPYHPTLNPSGLGNAVSDYIDVSPFFDAENEVRVIPGYTITNCTASKAVEFHIDQAGIPDEVRGYEVKFYVDPAVAAITDVTEGTFLSSAGTTQFYTLDGGGGIYTVSCAILGGGGGGAGHGSLFFVELTPAAEGTCAIDITSVKVRDMFNNPLPAGALDGSLQVDCTAPTMEPIAEAEGGWYNAAPVLSNFGFDDDVDLDLADYNYDGGSWTAIFGGWNGASWDNDPWTLPGFAGLSEGTHTIHFRIKDDAGNWNAVTYSWQFYKDTMPPEPPIDFAAAPGHSKTHLSWTNPVGDPTFAGVEIRLNGWLNYPQYSTAPPEYPPDHTAGTFVALVAGSSHDDNPRAPRDIYYYSAFSKDLAGNYSDLGTTAYDRCTSYWLGDVDSLSFNGLVNLTDLVYFSNTFGVSEGGGGWNAHCDFGPTDDWSRFGVPEPDNVVDFEDLMIFAMNYGNVAPSGLSEYAAPSRAIEDLEDLVVFKLVSNEDGSVSIVLENDAKTLKGMRLAVTVEGGTLGRVERGALFLGAGELFFGLVPAAPNTADISAAALGVEVPFARSGEIARLAVESGGNAPRVRIAAIELRDLDNVKNEIATAEGYEPPFVPKATALLQNFPNPFNPVTTIAFDLAAAGTVRIDIYDVSGRLIATAVNATKGAGRHRVEWNGRDASGSLVPSGIYFFRMKTAGYDATRKMILVR